MQKVLFFAATLFAGLIAGGQYLVWWDYNPAGNSPDFYVEKLQYAIRVIGTPLFAVQIATAILTLASTLVVRRQRPAFFLLLAASILCVTGVLLTFFGNIPLLNQIETWNAASPPSDWMEIARRWWLIHNVRFAIQLTAFSLLIAAALSTPKPSGLRSPTGQ